jgi:hypothetical protein
MDACRSVIAVFLTVVSVAVMPASSAASQEPRWGSLHAEVSIGANGKVTKVVLLEDTLSKAVQSSVIDSVRKWEFEPVRVDGVAVPALTYVNFEACAIPSGDGYDLAVHYVDNGPLLDRAALLEFSAALLYYGNDHQSIKVRLMVAADGRASLQNVVMVDVAPMVQRDMRSAVRDWVRSMRFKPEQIGGRAVATELEWPIELTIRTIGERYQSVDVATDPACKSARAASESPHAINDPIKRRTTAATPETAPPAK